MTRRYAASRRSDATKQPRGRCRSPRDRPHLGPAPGGPKPASPPGAQPVAARVERVSVRFSDPKHRAQEREEPGGQIARPARRAVTGTEPAGAERLVLLLRLAERDRGQSEGVPGALDGKKEEPRPGRNREREQPPRRGAEKGPHRPAEEVEEREQPERDQGRGLCSLQRRTAREKRVCQKDDEREREERKLGADRADLGAKGESGAEHREDREIDGGASERQADADEGAGEEERRRMKRARGFHFWGYRVGPGRAGHFRCVSSVPSEAGADVRQPT